MAGSSRKWEEEMESLLCSFDLIYKDFGKGMEEISSLKSSLDIETKRRQSLQLTCTNLYSENQRLVKAYTESLSKIAHQIESRSKCKSLNEELKTVKEDCLNKQREHNEAVELLKQDHAKEIEDLKTQIRCFQLQQAANEETITQLRNDLAAHKTHIDSLNRRMEQVHVNVESTNNQELQDLKDWLLVEQEEKKQLNRKLQNVEKELMNSRKKFEEHQRDSTSNRHVETIKQRILKLRKENEVLKRQVHDFKESNGYMIGDRDHLAVS